MAISYTVIDKVSRQEILGYTAYWDKQREKQAPKQREKRTT
jgi:hypothetical protein